MLLGSSPLAHCRHQAHASAGVRGTRQPVPSRARVCTRARGEGNPLDESVLERLRAAEEEAARLRQQLAKEQGDAQGGGTSSADSIDGQVRRVDGVEPRETLFTATKDKPSGGVPGWLNEADVQFFLGAAAPNPESIAAAEQGEDPEAKAIIQRRLLIGAALTVAAGAFALVPTESLRLKPSKPLYFYIVPLLRIRDLLANDSPPIIENADWTQLRVLLSRVQGIPNNVHSNLDSIVALLDRNTNQGRVQQLRAEFEEYLADMDFNKYYESLPGVTITAQQNQEFVKFSSQAQKAALQRLDTILKLLPANEVEQAIEASRIY